MNHEYTLMFLELRKQKKIGRIWPAPGGYRVAPLHAIEGMNDFNLARSESCHLGESYRRIS